MRAAIFLVALAYLSSLAGHCQTPKKYPDGDLRALNQMATKWGHYWNTHNMDSMGTLLRPDMDFITVGDVAERASRSCRQSQGKARHHLQN